MSVFCSSESMTTVSLLYMGCLVVDSVVWNKIMMDRHNIINGVADRVMEQRNNI